MRDAKGQISRVPAQPSSDSQTSGDASDDSPSNSSAVVKPEAWTSFWASSSSPLTGSLRVTDVVLRIGPDAAIVWTLASFPAGLPRTNLPWRFTAMLCCEQCACPSVFKCAEIQLQTGLADSAGFLLHATCQQLNRDYLVFKWRDYPLSELLPVGHWRICRHVMHSGRC